MLLRLYFYARKSQKFWCAFICFILLQKANKRCGQRDLNYIKMHGRSTFPRYKHYIVWKEHLPMPFYLVCQITK